MARWVKSGNDDWINLDQASIIYVEKSQDFSGWQITVEIDDFKHMYDFYSTKESAQKNLDFLMESYE